MIFQLEIYGQENNCERKMSHYNFETDDIAKEIEEYRAELKREVDKLNFEELLFLRQIIHRLLDISRFIQIIKSIV